MLESHVEFRTMLRAISDAHLDFITKTEAEILALIDAGYKNEEIADAMRIDASTVRRHVHDLAHKVFDGTDAPADRDKLRTWIPRHFKCCTRSVQKMLNNGRMLA